ncbi:MAG: hypothetical protein Kow00120_27600 [Anaerolineae bacterium]
MSGTEPGDNVDQRIHRYMSAIERMIGGVFDLDLGPHADDALGELGRGLEALAGVLAARSRELESLSFITEQLNAGLVLDDTLEQVYYTFRNVIPYNRIGFSLLVEEEGETLVRARWAKTDQPDVALEVGYQAPLAGSSLQHIVDTGEPRILNNLEAYLQEHPNSESTRLMLREGIRSSLTCPLIANGVCIGFMFFSSIEPNTYHQAHVRIFKQIAGELSLIVEKGRLVDRLLAKNAATEAQNRQLHELNEMKNRFLGMAAHDLRNPLAVALSASQYLLEAGDAPLTDDQRDLAGIIERSTRRMLTLLTDLLDVYRIETGHLELALVEVELEPLLEHAIAMHRLLASNKAITIDGSHIEPLSARADADRISQVIDNLISNAVKYSPAGSTVTVTAQRRGDRACVSVKDQGPGIPQDERRRLFKEFGRLSTRTTGGETSTGLGLAISKRIIEAHSGEIGITNRSGKGSTFWFTLPLAD